MAQNESSVRGEAPWLTGPPLTAIDILKGLRPWLDSTDDAEVLAALFVIANLEQLPKAVSVHEIRDWHYSLERQPAGLFGPSRKLVFDPRSRLVCNELLCRIWARDLKAADHD